MTSIYFDHKAIFGADEKPILNAKHRKHVASVPLDRTFNQESQTSAAPSKRKNRFTNESVGIDSTTGKPTENYSYKEPISYQNVKYEDDNVRFLATGKRLRPNDVNNRRYQKFQTATQRISSLNVYPDGSKRQGNESVPYLEKMIELMQNPPIQATLGKSVPYSGTPFLYDSLDKSVMDPITNPILDDSKSRIDSVSSTIDEKGDLIDPEELANAITSSIIFDKSTDPSVKKALIEAQFNKIIGTRKQNILDQIENAKKFTQKLINQEEKEGRNIPPELQKISDKIKMFEESKFEKNYKKIQKDPKNISNTNKQALLAVSTLFAKAPSPKAPNPQKTLLSISPTSLSDSKEQSPKAPNPKALSPISITVIDKLIAKIMDNKIPNEGDYIKLIQITGKNKIDIVETLEMQGGKEDIAKDLQSAKEKLSFSSKAESKEEFQDTGKAEAQEFIKKNKLNERDSFSNFINKFDYVKKSNDEQYQIRKQFMKVYNDKGINISDLQLQNLLNTRDGRLKMVNSVLNPYSQIGSDIYDQLKNENKNKIFTYSLGKLKELTIPDLNDIMGILTNKYRNMPSDKANFTDKEYKKIHQARILVLTLLKGDKVDIKKISGYSAQKIRSELYQLNQPLK